MEIKIEKDIPVPTTIYAKTGITALMRMLEVGDSFEISADRGPQIYNRARHLGIKVARRKKTNSDVVRVWRIA